MFDLKNREIKKVECYVPNEVVCFTMKNGLAYLVNLKHKAVYIDIVWWNFFKMDPYFEDGDKIPKEQLLKAKQILATAKLPPVNRDLEERYKNFYNKK